MEQASGQILNCSLSFRKRRFGEFVACETEKRPAGARAGPFDSFASLSLSEQALRREELVSFFSWLSIRWIYCERAWQIKTYERGAV